MKKTPTAFDRDWDGDRSRVVNTPHKDCAWVFAGEGVATRKLDGTSCMIRDGKLYRRRELRKGDAAPPSFEVADVDDETGKTVGWVPVDSDPTNRWHLEAFDTNRVYVNGTYELVGPKIQGNPERYAEHELVNHEAPDLILDPQPPRDFEGLRAWMTDQDIEGVVWHHSDGRMAKLKLRDFGLKRKR